MKRVLTTLVALALGMTAFAQFGPGYHGGGKGTGYSRRPSHSYSGRPGHGFGGRSGRGYGMDGVLELGFSINEFSCANHADRPDRLGLFGEFRVDMGGYADMGLQLSTTFGRGQLLRTMEDTWYWQGASLIVGDFNILPYSAFNPYIGIGIGPGIGYQRNKDRHESEWIHSLVLAPRIGVELFECLRMSVQYQWYLNDIECFSHLALGLSWAFQPGRDGRRPMR